MGAAYDAANGLAGFEGAHQAVAYAAGHLAGFVAVPRPVQDAAAARAAQGAASRLAETPDAGMDFAAECAAQNRFCDRQALPGAHQMVLCRFAGGHAVRFPAHPVPAACLAAGALPQVAERRCAGAAGHAGCVTG